VQKSIIPKVDSKKSAINLGEREPPVKLGAKHNGKNPKASSTLRVLKKPC